ncbi:hypothetical protein HIM_05986 [Hirsutella minnesotensis 3608]|uniref:AMP-dependent synthetase/ligase domain-containing protein n=1 Tax=Hirsutella minnesotensis 3608 TaxID=1043627 RepID=A0A0F7ZJR3_9HYPO|nr:hypothetical protein HIM_05986 [Hirsutella minnesotensis 3608]
MEPFPNDPVLARLLQSAKLTAEVVVHDDYGFDKTYAELLGDILRTREALRKQLPPWTLDAHGILIQENPYIAALTRGGYEFIVAFFAIRAIGGVCMPLASGTLIEEAVYFITLIESSCLVSGAFYAEHSRKIGDALVQNGHAEFTTLEVSVDAPPVGNVDIGISNQANLAPHGLGMVLFISGSTGKPKAAVLPRQCLVFEHPPPPGGMTLNYRTPLPPAEDVWDVLKMHRVTALIFNPTLLRGMKEVWVNKIAKLPSEERDKYLAGLRNIGKIKCNGATLPPTLLEFWSNLAGMPFQNGYGSTECGGGVIETDVNKPITNKHGIGFIVTDPPMDVKLANGDNGEILVKSPWMMIKYVGDEAATTAAFDEQGYLKTGDLGLYINGEYVFNGRSNTDYINRIPRIPVEDALSGLPYAAEAYVVAVPGSMPREYCAALIRVNKDSPVPQDQVTLKRIHADVSDVLPAYMRPYMLRVVDATRSRTACRRSPCGGRLSASSSRPAGNGTSRTRRRGWRSGAARRCPFFSTRPSPRPPRRPLRRGIGWGCRWLAETAIRLHDGCVLTQAQCQDAQEEISHRAAEEATRLQHRYQGRRQKRRYRLVTGNVSRLSIAAGVQRRDRTA